MTSQQIKQLNSQLQEVLTEYRNTMASIELLQGQVRQMTGDLQQLDRALQERFAAALRIGDTYTAIAEKLFRGVQIVAKQDSADWWQGEGENPIA